MSRDIHKLVKDAKVILGGWLGQSGFENAHDFNERIMIFQLKNTHALYIAILMIKSYSYRSIALVVTYACGN